MLRSISS
jgi:hypothetical protein